jgi:hypothetical protein
LASQQDLATLLLTFAFAEIILLVAFMLVTGVMCDNQMQPHYAD